MPASALVAFVHHLATFAIAIALAFAAIGLLSIRPTVTFLSWRGALAQNRVPVLAEDAQRNLRLIVHLELALLALAILCAALMAKGVGFFGG